MGTGAGGLTKAAAVDLDYRRDTRWCGIIDAHAGGIGSMGSVLKDSRPGENPFEQSLALIGGTSSCHMVVSREPGSSMASGALLQRHGPRHVVERRRTVSDGLSR